MVLHGGLDPHLDGALWEGALLVGDLLGHAHSRNVMSQTRNVMSETRCGFGLESHHKLSNDSSVNQSINLLATCAINNERQ